MKKFDLRKVPRLGDFVLCALLAGGTVTLSGCDANELAKDIEDAKEFLGNFDNVNIVINVVGENQEPVYTGFDETDVVIPTDTTVFTEPVETTSTVVSTTNYETTTATTTATTSATTTTVTTTATSTTSATTTAATTTTTTITKPVGEKQIVTSSDKLTYERNNGESIYIILPGDNLYRLAIKFNTTEEKLREMNEFDEEYIIKAGDSLKVPAITNVYYSATYDMSVSYAAIKTGESEDTIMMLNGIRDKSYVFKKGERVLVHQLDANEYNYKSGDKYVCLLQGGFAVRCNDIISAFGFAGAGNNYLVLNNNETGNTVYWYSFDGARDYTVYKVCQDAIGIGFAASDDEHAIPVAFLNSKSIVSSGYERHGDSYGNEIVTFNNDYYNALGFEKSNGYYKETNKTFTK